MRTFLVSGTHDPALCPGPACPQGGREQQWGTASLAHGTLTALVARGPFQGGPQGPLSAGRTLCLGLFHSRARRALTPVMSCVGPWDASRGTPAPVPVPASEGILSWWVMVPTGSCPPWSVLASPQLGGTCGQASPFGVLTTQDRPCPVHQSSEASQPSPAAQRAHQAQPGLIWPHSGVGWRAATQVPPLPARALPGNDWPGTGRPS